LSLKTQVITIVAYEYAAEIVASLSYVMLQAGDSVGFALFNDKIVEKFKQIYS